MTEPDPIQQFWTRFAEATGVDADYDAWAFGGDGDADMADELAYLVLHGPKRATTGLHAEAVEEDEMPVVGGYSVILGGSGAPVCIIRTTGVEVRPFGEVDAEYAWVEGEGDRSLEFWRQIHIDYFREQGYEITDGTPMVLERFDLVWPQSAAE